MANKYFVNQKVRFITNKSTYEGVIREHAPKNNDMSGKDTTSIDTYLIEPTKLVSGKNEFKQQLSLYRCIIHVNKICDINVMKGYAYFSGDRSVGINPYYYDFEIPSFDINNDDRDEVREKLQKLYTELDGEFKCQIIFQDEN